MIFLLPKRHVSDFNHFETNNSNKRDHPIQNTTSHGTDYNNTITTQLQGQQTTNKTYDTQKRTRTTALTKRIHQRKKTIAHQQRFIRIIVD